MKDIKIETHGVEKLLKQILMRLPEECKRHSEGIKILQKEDFSMILIVNMSTKDANSLAYARSEV